MPRQAKRISTFTRSENSGSEDPGGTASGASFCLQKQVGMAIVLFDRNMGGILCCAFFKPFPSAASHVFRHKDVFLKVPFPVTSLRPFKKHKRQKIKSYLGTFMLMMP